MSNKNTKFDFAVKVEKLGTANHSCDMILIWTHVRIFVFKFNVHDTIETQSIWGIPCSTGLFLSLNKQEHCVIWSDQFLAIPQHASLWSRM